VAAERAQPTIRKETELMLALINDTGMLVVVLAVVVLFGASRLPKLARSLGEAGREFRKAHDEADTPAEASPAVPAPVAIGSDPESVVTLSRAELDALIAAKAAGTESPRPA
jgi:sec-independent protein translocase protein TatA